MVCHLFFLNLKLLLQLSTHLTEVMGVVDEADDAYSPEHLIVLSAALTSHFCIK